ncbi:hypothetical protein [Xanthovirga aplysinae]|uniref:hypothetical protein n=1 Tax=Xanthovirga aplysinae TaxID=2529853 RepID=UPI0012BCCEC8|nr:hypothetical protein [Xanthovirga aplysinae]MTI32105.1 hypothetical protein [Xanthovirga aplysinae]
MKKISFFSFLITLFLLNNSNLIHAQKRDGEKRFPEDFISFFTGKWHGQGEFASGMSIQADLSFEMTLDGTWMIYHHTDGPPTSFKATSMWGVDKWTGEFKAHIFDNFKGHRSFESQGWKNDKLILTTKRKLPNGDIQFERFVYEKLSPDRFKMTFAISKDKANWRMFDYLIFNRSDEDFNN